jgi:hypothetical protein
MTSRTALRDLSHRREFREAVFEHVAQPYLRFAADLGPVMRLLPTLLEGLATNFVDRLPGAGALLPGERAELVGVVVETAREWTR